MTSCSATEEKEFAVEIPIHVAEQDAAVLQEGELPESLASACEKNGVGQSDAPEVDDWILDSCKEGLARNVM